jgi:hypothetical protein
MMKTMKYYLKNIFLAATCMSVRVSIEPSIP